MIFVQRDVVRFEKGAILRKEMLESVYSYPRFLTESFYSSYSDGILYGLEWSESGGKHYISPGAVKFKGNIYYQPEAVAIEEIFANGDLEDGQEYYLYYKEMPVVSTYSCDTYRLSLSLEKNPISNGLCYKYILFELDKFKTLDNKRIYGLPASPDKYGFAIPFQIIQNEVMPELEKKERKHPLDFEIMTAVLNHNAIAVGLIMLYIDEYNRFVPDKSKQIECVPTSESVRYVINCFKKAASVLSMPVYTKIVSEDDVSNTVVSSSGGCML